MAARREKILVALSGGPASAIAASLLRNQDYDLIAVHGKVKHSNRLPVSHCCPERNEEAVVQLCEKLSIPLIIEDMTSAVEGQVLVPLLEARIEGKVSDPCIAFHSEVLLPRLWEIAQRSRATQIATGHFARISIDRQVDQKPDQKVGPSDQTGGAVLLLSTPDLQSDQSPLLSRASSAILRHLQLPLSEIPETMMRKLAEELGLDLGASPADQEPSMESAPWKGSDCYPEELMTLPLFRNFAAKTFLKPGAVRSIEHYVSAEHSGICEARVGLESRHLAGETVLNIFPATQTIVVGRRERLRLATWDLHSIQMKGAAAGIQPIPLQVRIPGRSESPVASLLLYSAGFGILRFEQAQELPGPGQVVILQDQSEVIGTAVLGESPVKLEVK